MPPPTPDHAAILSLRTVRALILVGALAAFFLGVFGYSLTHPLPDAIYGALQLFVMQANIDAPHRTLQIARFLAPATTIVSAALAGFALFRDEWAHSRLRGLHGHVVICGAGAKGAHLAEEFLDAGDTVVLVDADVEQPALARLRRLRAIVVAGDIAAPETLQEARAGSARLVVATTGSDELNVAVVAQVRALGRQHNRTAADPLHCIVHVADPMLRNALQRQRLLSGDGCDVRLIDAYALAARRFLAEHPLELGLTGEEDQRPVHLVILGLGTLGRALLMQAIRTAHYANLRPMRVTIIDAAAAEKVKRLRWLWPTVDLVCELQVISGDFLDPAVMAQMKQACLAEVALCTVAVCVDSDAHAMTVGMRIRDELVDVKKLRLAVRLKRPTDLALLQPAAGTADTATVVHLSSHASALHRDDVLLGTLDAQARAVHEAYVAEELRKKPTLRDQTVAPWDQQPAAVQESNRQQADHIPVKLRAIGCRIAPGRASEPFAFGHDEIELMAKMEHARWCSDQVLAGWTLGPRDDRARTKPDLVPWAQLSEDVRDKDRNPVRNIPDRLAEVGYHVERVTASPHP